MDPVLYAIKVVAELERTGTKFQHAGGELLTLCPFHVDTSPSCSINTTKKVFQCRAAGCARSGDFIDFLCGRLQAPRSVIYIELAARYKVEQDKPIAPELIEKYHAEIWHNKALLDELYKRGVTDELIRKKRYGVNNGRIMIPVKSVTGMYVNIRQYLPGAPGREKMRNLPGRGKQRWYPIDQLQYDHIVLFGGEIKADVAGLHLNPHNIGAITATTGEHNLDVELIKQFAGKKRIDACMDIDRAGRSASRQHCQFISGVCSDVREIILPLSPAKYPKGDVNDFIGQENGDIFKCVESAEPFVPAHEANLTDAEPEDTELISAIDARSAHKRLRVKGIVSSVDTAPYIVPKLVAVKCDKNQTECAICPVFANHTNDEYTISPESSAILEMVNTKKSGVRDGLMCGIGIPRTCKVCTFEAKDFYNVEDCRISPQLEITNRAADRILQPAYCIGSNLELNDGYEFIGRMYPHPDTQQSTLLISSCKLTNDALTNYVSNPDTLNALKIFQPGDGVNGKPVWTKEALAEKLADIYRDFAANVTRIQKRDDIHLMTDLYYHSPLFIQFDGRKHKGWTEILILGDSSQGKSEVACGADGRGGLMAHYQLGARVECKNASVAGLLGGCQQQGNGRWFVTWGLMPMNDKRGIIFEEVKGMPKEVIAKCTDMRSSGQAEIPKIEKRKANARCRGLWISNPRGEMPLAGHSFGVEAIIELIGSMEDIRRFDCALIVSETEIAPELLNKLQSERPQIPHKYTTDLCRAAVLHAWTRDVNKGHIVFSETAEKLCLENATILCNEFTSALPLLDRGSTRLKLARLSASLACRTFSTEPNNADIIRVRACHVEYMVDTLRRIYSSDVFGYAAYTAALEINERLVDPDKITSHINTLPYPVDFVKHALKKDKLDVQDLRDWCNYEANEALDLMSFLVRKHAVRRENRLYRKTPPFIVLLKTLLENTECGKPGGLIDKPDRIKKREY